MFLPQNTKTKRILDLLRHKARTAREIIDALMPIDPDTYKVTKRLLGYMDVPKFDYKIWKREEEKRFYMLLAKLRKERLIEKRNLGIKTAWKLTENGIKKLIHYAQIKPKPVILPQKKYTKKEINDKILVIFDIPEAFKDCRAWLRFQLKTLGFTILQKSVWIGAYAIPADFIHDLRENNLLKYIHIFKISKKGSLDA